MLHENSINEKLKNDYKPSYLDVVNESDQHNVPKDSETHFKIVLVSDLFSGLPKVRRHQQVYQTLSNELAGEVHALALHLYSPEEWTAQKGAPDSPKCLGGEK